MGKGYDWGGFMVAEPPEEVDPILPDGPGGYGSDWVGFLQSAPPGLSEPPAGEGSSGGGFDWEGFLGADPEGEPFVPDTLAGEGSDWVGFLSAAFVGEPFVPEFPGTSEGGFDWGGFLYITPEGFVQFSPSVFGRLLLAVENATGAVNLILPAQTGNAGKVLLTNGSTVSWETISEFGGTLTNVGLTAPDIFSVANSPVTGTGGTIALGLAEQTANTVWAGPVSGADAVPSFRALVAGDIPDLSATYQPKDADLTAIAALATTSFGRGFLPLADAGAARSYIGAGTSSFSGAYGDLSGLPDLTVYQTKTGTLALAGFSSITGTLPNANLDTELQALAGLTSAADKLPYFTGSGTAGLADFTAFGRSLVDDADATTARTTLGLGTAATVNTGTTSGTIPLLGTGGKLPAVDGSLLTNVYNADKIARVDASGSDVTGTIGDLTKPFATVQAAADAIAAAGDHTGAGYLVILGNSSESGFGDINLNASISYFAVVGLNPGAGLGGITFNGTTDANLLLKDCLTQSLSVPNTTLDVAVELHASQINGIDVASYVQVFGNGANCTVGDVTSQTQFSSSPFYGILLDNVRCYGTLTSNGKPIQLYNVWPERGNFNNSTYATLTPTIDAGAGNVTAVHSIIKEVTSGGTLSLVDSVVVGANAASSTTKTAAWLLTPTSSGSGLTSLNATQLTSGTVPAARMPALTGDVTTSAGAVATTIANNAVTLAKMADIATASFLGRNTASTGDPEVLSMSTARTMLGLVIGTNVQAWDADLDSWAGVTRASGFDTFTATPTMANLKSLLTDETTVGWNLFSAPNPSAISFPKVAADNTVSFRTPAQVLSDIGAQAAGSYAASGANTDITSVLLNQTGLVVKGGDANALTIKPNETLTAGRILNLVVHDASRTIDLTGNLTLANNLTTSGNFALTLTQTGTTNVTLPTTGTLATLAGSETLTNKTLTSPTMTGASSTAITSLGLRDTSAAFDVTLAATSSTTLTAGRTLTLDVTNAARTLKLTGNPTLADWFDQSVKTTASPTFAGATIGQEAWTAPTLLNSWVNLGGSNRTAGYMKDSMGFVHLRGLIKDGTTTAGTTLWTLPAGYRPSQDEYFVATTAGTPFSIFVDTSGNVKLNATAGANVAIFAVFRAD